MTLSLVGRNLNSNDVEVLRVADGSEDEYTPLSRTPDSFSYVLQDNGLYRIILYGKTIAAVRLHDVVLATKRTTQVSAALRRDSAASTDNVIYRESTTARCLNYPYMTREDYPYMVLVFNHTSDKPLPLADITFSNCRVVNTLIWSTITFATVLPSSPLLPVTAVIDGYIAFVGNYKQSSRRRR